MWKFYELGWAIRRIIGLRLGTVVILRLTRPTFCSIGATLRLLHGWLILTKVDLIMHGHAKCKMFSLLELNVNEICRYPFFYVSPREREG